MKKVYLIAAFLMLAIGNVWAADEAAKPADGAQSTPNFAVIEVPIYAQKLRFKMPTDWKHVNTKQNDKAYLLEFVPFDEDLVGWTNLFSVQGAKDFDPAIKPEDVANTVVKNFFEICPESVIYTKVGSQFISGQEAFIAIIGCAEMPKDNITGLKKGMSEISYYVFIKGQRDLYIAHKSVRGPGFSPDKFPPFVEEAMADLKDFLPLEFCKLSSPRGTCEQ